MKWYYIVLIVGVSLYVGYWMGQNKAMLPNMTK